MNRSPYQDICTFFSSRRLQLIPSGARNLLGISHRVGRNAGSSGRQMYRPWAGQARGNISMLQDRWRIPSVSAPLLRRLRFLQSGGLHCPPRREKTGPERTSRAVSPLEYAPAKAIIYFAVKYIISLAKDAGGPPCFLAPLPHCHATFRTTLPMFCRAWIKR